MAMTPPPYKPDASQLNYLVAPLVDVFKKYGEEPEIRHKTYHHPEGVRVQLKAATPVIADSPARVQAVGFVGHSATCLCAYCSCRKGELDKTNIAWVLRSGVKVREQAATWLSQQSTKLREEEEKKNGVRWTPLHRLPYWDPVKHMVLGFMHNWLEGVVQEHQRTLWGIGRRKADNAKVDQRQADEKFRPCDVKQSESELSSLSEPETEDERRYRKTSDQSSTSSNSRMDVDESTDDEGTPTPKGTPTQAPFLQLEPEEDSESDDEDDEDDDEFENKPIPETVFKMSKTQVEEIRACIQNASIPSCMERLPPNLGEASHGKLKAHEYLTLYSVILPLIVPEFWHSHPQPAEEDKMRLENFQHLVACTNIICSFRTSKSEADAYTDLYGRYRRSSRELYPFWPSKPNHHYATHNGAILEFWGPLPVLSEFFGERLIGMCQQVNTNHKLRE